MLDAKVDIRDIKVDIENILSEKGSDFSVKTNAYIHRLFEKIGLDGIFGRSAVMELLELKSSGASKEWHLPVEQIIHLFKEADVLGYIEKCYGIFHCEGDEAVLEDITEFCKERG